MIFIIQGDVGKWSIGRKWKILVALMNWYQFIFVEPLEFIGFNLIAEVCTSRSHCSVHLKVTIWPFIFIVLVCSIVWFFPFSVFFASLYFVNIISILSFFGLHAFSNNNCWCEQVFTNFYTDMFIKCYTTRSSGFTLRLRPYFMFL